MKITWKLTLASSLIVYLLITLISTILLKSAESALLSAHRRHLLTSARFYRYPSPMMRIPLPKPKRFYVSVNGRVISDPYGIGTKLPKEDGIHEIDGEYYLVMTIKRDERTLKLAENVTVLIEGLEKLKVRAMYLSLLGAGLSFVAAFLIANLSLSPLRRILSELERISPENLGERVSGSGSGDEIDDLALKINSMLDRIERAYRSQERFVHDVSHELRNPLTSMKGFLGVLKRWGLEDEKIFRESIEEIEGSVKEMEALIENLLVLARSENLEMERVNLRGIAEEVVENLLKEYPGREVNIEGNSEIVANLDSMKIIIRNLVENALKYTDGRVWIRLKDGCLEVTDEGEEIPEEIRDRIFEKFFRGDKSRDRRKKGFGIGLSLVKELSERMGMKVELESKNGNTFRIVWGDGCESLRKEDPEGNS